MNTVSTNMNRVTYALLLVFCLFVFALIPPAPAVAGSSVTLTPAVTDEKAKARDTLNESVTITNNTNRMMELYPVVDNVSSQDGSQSFTDPSKADLSSSLANWILFTRAAIDLKPGEKRSIDYTIQVNLAAKPGIYHARILFPEGPNRAAAEANVHQASAVEVNVEVQADNKDAIQLTRFAPDKTFFFRSPVSLSYHIENIGNQPEQPTGEITIYDRQGKEVASIPVNKNDTTILPDGSLTLASIWQAAGGLGQYKARIDLEYGNGQKSLQDIALFWVLPWQKIVLMLLAFIALASAIISILYYHHRKYVGDHYDEDQN